mmetsp:Transcript_29469/g.72272  ORF Transcript_29469/g.72272 Transcript_29469/m.72272 type:complete len:233 (-) Transcript_29469:322-1020(-)
MHQPGEGHAGGAGECAAVDTGHADNGRVKDPCEPHLHSRHHGSRRVQQRAAHRGHHLLLRDDTVCNARVRRRRDNAHNLAAQPLKGRAGRRHPHVHHHHPPPWPVHRHGIQPHRQHRPPQRPHRPALAHVLRPQRSKGRLGSQAPGSGCDGDGGLHVTQATQSLLRRPAHGRAAPLPTGRLGAERGRHDAHTDAQSVRGPEVRPQSHHTLHRGLAPFDAVAGHSEEQQGRRE